MLVYCMIAYLCYDRECVCIKYHSVRGGVLQLISSIDIPLSGQERTESMRFFSVLIFGMGLNYFDGK